MLAVGLVAAAGGLSTGQSDEWLDVLAIGVGGWLVALGLALFACSEALARRRPRRRDHQDYVRHRRT